MSSRQFKRIGAMLVFALGVAGAGSAQAAMTLEFNFNEPAVGTTVTASEAAPGVPNTATLFGDASTTTDTAVGTGVKDDARIGYYTNADRSGDRLTTTATYSQIFGSTGDNFGSGAAIVVVKPDTNWGASRQWFFQHGSLTGNPNALSFFTEGGPRIAGGRSGDNENSFDLGLPEPAGGWRTDTWYFIGVSWQESSGPEAVDVNGNGVLNGLNDGHLRVYIRTLKVGDTLTPDSTAQYAFAEDVSIWFTRADLGAFNGTLNLGNRNTSSPSEAVLGDMALFRFYDTLFNQADFDSVFQSLLPEPGSAGLLAFASIIALRRTRRGHHAR